MNRLLRTLVTGALLAASFAVAPAPAATAAACDTTVMGAVAYYDAAGGRHSVPNLLVQAVDYAWGPVGSGFTDNYGQFFFCFDSAVGRVIHMRYFTAGPRWAIRANAGELYSWTSPAQPVTPGVQVYFGQTSPPTATGTRLLRMFEQVNAAWEFVPKTGRACFDPMDTACRHLDLVWDTETPNGPYYARGTNTLYIDRYDVDDPLAVARQLAYALMDDVYEDAWPQTPNCAPRDPARSSSAGCAWVEGFADWLAATFTGQNLIHWPDGRIFDLESGGWHTDWDKGDATELRVGAALFDLADATDPGYGGPWDRYGEGTANIWHTFTRNPTAATLQQFWTHRAADGFNVANNGALAALYQNTIDYQFREPLPHGSVHTRPTPTPHGYVTSGSPSAATLVAIRPSPGADHHLSVFPNHRLDTAPLATSAATGAEVDVVAVKGFGELYPKVYMAGGSGQYDIQATTAEWHWGGHFRVSMPSADIVRAWNVSLNYYEHLSVSVTPTNAGQNPSLFLFESPDPGSYAYGTGDAVAASHGGGPGAPETLSRSAWEESWEYTIVLVNQAGGGDYDVNISVTY